jgi:hypothetical protein
MAGGVPTSVTPKKAAAAIRGFRARTAPDKIRLELAKELITDFARFDEQLAANSRRSCDCSTSTAHTCAISTESVRFLLPAF